MRPTYLATALQWAAFIAVVASQQFPIYVYPYQLMGLSESCFHAVNTTVALCPDWIALHSAGLDPSLAVLAQDQLSELCKASCRTELSSLRSSIASACGSSTDVMVMSNIAYPATFITDRMLYAYDISCRRDSSTGEYCDVLVAEAWNATGSNSTGIPEDCSDCRLGTWQFQLESPFGYASTYAEAFAKATSSCSSEGYAYQTPTSYALNTTTITASQPTCTSTYTVKQNDTCASISNATSVSTDGLITANALDVACSMLPAAGKTLCLPGQCQIRKLVYGDACASLASNYNITISQILAWNPIFNSDCTNIRSWVGWYICLSSPHGSLDVPSGDTTTTAAPVPTNAQGESNTNCAQWYTVNSGDYCSLISLSHGISLSDFYFLNPEVNSECTNLWLGYSYCVKAVGNIATYPGYTTTTPSTSFVRPTKTTTTVATYTSTLFPTASGTISGCFYYKDAVDSEWSDLAGVNLNECVWAAANGEVTVDELLEWNPSLDRNSCELQQGYSYCIQKVKVVAAQDETVCDVADSSLIMVGTTTACTCYLTITRGDYEEETYGCDDFFHFNNVTSSDLVAWNPWVGDAGNCVVGMVAGLDVGAKRQVCVGTTVTSTTSTSSSVALPTITTTTSTSAAPTQTGIVSGCTLFYTAVSGDSCYNIATAYGITLDQFYAWNPAVGTGCLNLWAGYGYCVAGPATATPTTSAGPPAPTQSGVISTCNKWYVVQSGDGCWAISNSYGISLDNFYAWNPSVGTNCSNLWLGYAVCVGIP